MTEILAFICGAGITWMYAEWRKIREIDYNDDWWLREFDRVVADTERDEDLAKQLYELELENADLHRDLEIKRKKLEDLGQ